MNFRKDIIGTIAITLVVVAIFMYFFKSIYDEGFYKKHREELLIKETLSKSIIDSIQVIRFNDSIALIDILNKKNLEIIALKDRYTNALNIIRSHEKELNKYRDSNINDRFSTFTELISNKDTIQR